MSDELDLEPFGRIVDRLGEAVAALAADPPNELYRDSVIKRFEPAYELARNTLRKFLLKDSAHLRRWMYYRQLRNRTAHTYDEEEADRVVAEVPAFLDEVRHLYAEMKKREVAYE